MKLIRFLAKLLVIIGALNWGLVGFFQYDAVADLFGGVASSGARIIYALVGLAGLYKIGGLFRCCKPSGGCGCGCGPSCGCSKKHPQ